MFTLLKNSLNGKNTAFHEAFRVPHQQLLHAVAMLPMPIDNVQLAFLQRLRGYLDGTFEFAHTLFYGSGNGPTICTDSELRALGQPNGQILYSMLLVGLIRYSLLAEREIADHFYNIVHEIIPPAVVPFVERLARELRPADPMTCERLLLGVMQQFFPRIASDFESQTLFPVYVAAFVAVLKQDTLNALSAGARNA